MAGVLGAGDEMVALKGLRGAWWTIQPEPGAHYPEPPYELHL